MVDPSETKASAPERPALLEPESIRVWELFYALRVTDLVAIIAVLFSAAGAIFEIGRRYGNAQSSSESFLDGPTKPEGYIMGENEPEISYVGANLRSFSPSSLQKCRNTCRIDPTCFFFTLARDSCYLKSVSFPKQKAGNDVISGAKLHE
jgi:hypothetical protein